MCDKNGWKVRLTKTATFARMHHPQLFFKEALSICFALQRRARFGIVKLHEHHCNTCGKYE